MREEPLHSHGPTAAGRPGYIVVYVLLAGLLIARIGTFYEVRTGFSSLITFGSKFEDRRLPGLTAVPLFTYPDSYGYDGQFYAQVAVAGNPTNPQLHKALDSPPYRMRRILMPLLVHAAGLGDPQRILQIFALANVACWLLLAVLLARWWFPPGDLHNLLCWGGTLFGHGALASIRHSLTDLPALLSIAIAVRMIEQNRRWLGAVLLAAAGLVRETSILCAGALLPRRDAPAREWPAAVVAVATATLPIVVWASLLILYFRSIGSSRNFTFPLHAYVERLGEVFVGWSSHGWTAGTEHVLWAFVALAVQAGFVLTRPKLDDTWWRIGAAYSMLWLCLGPAVWEGFPPAAARAVLPLTLAFNVLAPRSRWGLALLVAGNLTVLSAAATLTPPDALFAAAP